MPAFVPPLRPRQRVALRDLARHGEVTALGLSDFVGRPCDARIVLRQLARRGLATYEGWDAWRITEAGREEHGKD